MNRSLRAAFRWLSLPVVVLLGCAMVLALSSCSSKRDSAIIGKWQGKGDSDIMEFRADGTFSIRGSGDPLSGKYSFVGGERIKITFDGVKGNIVRPSVWQAVVRGDTLDLTNPDGEVDHFQRVR